MIISMQPPTPAQMEKESRLAEWCRAHGSVLVGFSGGVDSAYLACVAVEALGPERVLAVIGRSATYPEAQWVRAREVADRFAVPVVEVATDELADERYAANPVNRCYFCKNELWSRLEPIAVERELAVIVDGTNADDRGDHRPGMRAARERNVASPLAELGFTKDDIRALSHRRGIPTWSQPSSPCLASRLPYGTAVTPERLGKVERAEAGLRGLGISGNLRVRFFGETAKVELDANELAEWQRAPRLAELERVVRAAGFEAVELNPEGFRSGAMNRLAGIAALDHESVPDGITHP